MGAGPQTGGLRAKRGSGLFRYIRGFMVRPPENPPLVYALLARSNNVAADRALVDALPELDSELQDVALDTLTQRSRPAGLALVVAACPDWTHSLRQRVIARAEGLSAGLRLAIDSDSADTRLAAVDIIRRGNGVKCAYLLANALTRPCPRTRRAAGQAIEQLVTSFLSRCSQHESPTAPDAERASQRQALAGAVRQAMNCWSAHRRTEVIRAAMWLAEDLEDVILTRVAQPRLKLSRVFEESLRGRLDPRMAAYAVRALRAPELRGPVAAWIGNCTDDRTMVAVLDNLWVAGDVEVYQALSSIRRLAWLEGGIAPLMDLPGGRAEAAAVLVASSGLPNEGKVNLLASMACSGPAALARAAVWQLVPNRTREASAALRQVSRHGEAGVARLAGRELQRRERAGQLSADFVHGADPPPAKVSTFDTYWAAFDRLDGVRQAEFGAQLREQQHDFDRCLRQKLASNDPADRTRAVCVVRRLRLQEELDASLYGLAHDADAVVRSSVMRALGHLDSPTSRRILSVALHDPDARVQANAIEALDALEACQYQSAVRDKLASPNGRVRANAVKMLLKLELREAVDALLNMLHGAARSDRLSALWVIECLRLQSLTDRLTDLACNDPDPQVRHRAVQVARSVGVEIPPAATPATEEAVT